MDPSLTRIRVVSPLVAIPLQVPLRRLDAAVSIPRYAHPGDAGVDLMTTSDVTLQPGERAVVGTGIAVALPTGYAGFVHPRSGLGARLGLTLVNAPGTIDSGYRGEVRVCLVNLDPVAPVELRRGDRIAQLVVQRVEQVEFTEVDDLDEGAPPPVRGAHGYGSTGGHAALVAEQPDAAGDGMES